MLQARTFQKLLLNWFDKHGRKTLPWQINKTPYRVWISEIMLQQTQVKTVIPYFQQFMERFPTLQKLAKAKEDEVLHLWAGLGYYSRARNLHRAAKMITDEFDGKFPDCIDTLQQLPGIGQSTAGAILSIAFEKPTAILDGNVKRVLTRIHGITEPVNDKQTETILWQLAKRYTPETRIGDYTQAIMDLGATLCTRSKPQCMECPLTKHCVAHQLKITNIVPQKKLTKTLPVRDAFFLVLQYKNEILFVKRPAVGIWGGLWSFPELPNDSTQNEIRLFCRQKYQLTVTHFESFEQFRHTFSHFHLNITPIVINVQRKRSKMMEDNQHFWYNLAHPIKVGLPKPVQLILRKLYDTPHTLHKIKQTS